MLARVREFLSHHPYPVGGVYLFSLYMTFVYLPYDFVWKALFYPIEATQEVWFGYMLTGWPAKLTEPLHWLVYGAMAYGFHRERPWAWTLAAVYTVQVAIGGIVFTALYWEVTAVQAIWGTLVVGGMLYLAWLLWRTRPQTTRPLSA